MASLTCTLKPASIPPGTLQFWIAGVLVIKLFKCVISSMEHIYASNELYIKATARPSDPGMFALGQYVDDAA